MDRTFQRSQQRTPGGSNYHTTPEAALEDLNINTNPPTKEEIITIIKSLNEKATVPDNLNAELFKIDPVVAANILSLFTDIWLKGKIPSDWTQGGSAYGYQRALYSIATTGGATHLYLFPARPFAK